MNRTGICPKCGSADIVRYDGDIRDYGAGNNLMLGMTRLSAVGINQYICTSCGYVEQWIDMIDMPKVINSKKIRRKKEI